MPEAQGPGKRLEALKGLVADNLRLRLQSLSIRRPKLQDEEPFVTLQVGKQVCEQVRTCAYMAWTPALSPPAPLPPNTQQQQQQQQQQLASAAACLHLWQGPLVLAHPATQQQLAWRPPT
jgi:hypothetical protein